MRPFMLKRNLKIAIVSVSFITLGILFTNMNSVGQNSSSAVQQQQPGRIASVRELYSELRQLKTLRSQSQLSVDALKILEAHERVIMNYLSSRLKIQSCAGLLALDPQLQYGLYTLHGRNGFFKAECGIKK